MILLYPKICNLCGGSVEYVSNAKIYGKPYGSGYCYHCRQCGAYVGTHQPRPREALGILANAEMREKKIQCHNLFDSMWRNGKQRRSCYRRLAEALNIPVADCHFGYFDLKQLDRALEILKAWANG